MCSDHEFAIRDHFGFVGTPVLGMDCQPMSSSISNVGVTHCSGLISHVWKILDSKLEEQVLYDFVTSASNTSSNVHNLCPLRQVLPREPTGNNGLALNGRENTRRGCEPYLQILVPGTIDILEVTLCLEQGAPDDSSE